ncbi:flagellar basal body-associated protein FliL [Campylobacter sp. faydin G-24]|uniref:Flagellar protein FliL n=1 Tax=Campylobacter anatolicus TaxID=2829105 RepID=A0ABS5HHB7_9BACT|nr:flagellar basal body-associated protein FliL [Campylobacter anatolicus]MBR8462207.1 flagellar basal body-associated protein FliL [Campylobacter anatolicus]MBR8463676.1 flagellar basal body-associated protein FliL [Campylobacter anatolicus]MBR8466411.1 flagellar basal body-associated protein FliL [Campylobacter anatolicus]
MPDEIEESKSKKNGGKSVLIVIIIAILVLLLIVGGLVMFLLSGEDEQMANTAPQAQIQQSAPAKQHGKRSSDFTNMGPIYPLDQFIVNLLSENGSRFLKTKIDMEQSSEQLTPELDKKKALLRDIIIRTLSSKTYEEVSTAKGKDRLKDEIVGKINEVLSDGYIKNIYFTDFVVQ